MVDGKLAPPTPSPGGGFAGTSQVRDQPTTEPSVHASPNPGPQTNPGVQAAR